MATQTEKLLNYNGLLYAFKKIINWAKPFGTTVRQSSQSGSSALPILTSTQSSPTSGNNYEAGYDTDLKFTPSSNTLTIGTGSLSPTAFSGKATQTETDLASSASGKGASMIGYDATNTTASGTIGGAIKALQDAVGGGDLVKSIDNATSFDPEISSTTELFNGNVGILGTLPIHGKVVARTGNYTKADNTSSTFTYYDTVYGLATNISGAAASAGAGLFRHISINNSSRPIAVLNGAQEIILDGGDIMVDVDNNESTYYNTTIEQAITTLDSKINNIVSSGLTRTIVTALPTTNISETTIYMILASNDTNVGDPSTSTSQNANAYNEYMYINSSWERIGSTEVNLDIDAITNNDIDTCWDTALAAT